MAGMLRFKVESVLAVVEHALAAPESMPTYGEREDGAAPGPGLMWFKDVGTGLMSSGLGVPGEVPITWAETEDGVLLKDVIYRDEPETFDVVWNATREICGGDDFVEKIALDSHTNLHEALKLATTQGFTWLTLKVDTDSYEVGFEK